MELTGRHVFAITAGAFAVIIGVNLVMAWQAIATFPGLEVRNSYVASQRFDGDRAAQLALGWQLDAGVKAGEMTLAFTDRDGQPVQVAKLDATIGRPTVAAQDRRPDFAFDGRVYRAPVDLGPGNWDLRLTATAEDGTAFRQRVELHLE